MQYKRVLMRLQNTAPSYQRYHKQIKPLCFSSSKWIGGKQGKDQFNIIQSSSAWYIHINRPKFYGSCSYRGWLIVLRIKLNTFCMMKEKILILTNKVITVLLKSNMSRRACSRNAIRSRSNWPHKSKQLPSNHKSLFTNSNDQKVSNFLSLIINNPFNQHIG